jgi:AcrR family transcriptional regulator
MRDRTHEMLTAPEPLRTRAEAPSSAPPALNSPERLLEAAGEIFAEKGFKGATVREIIDRAGVNIAAVNYYFRNKERLYIEAVKHVACVKTDGELNWPANTPPEVKLRDFIHFHLRGLLDPNKPAWHMRLMMRELSHPSAACTELVRDYIEPKSQILTGILRELLPPNTPRRKVFLTACSVIGQCIFHCSHKPIIMLLAGENEYKHLDPATLAEHITEFSLRALKEEE